MSLSGKVFGSVQLIHTNPLDLVTGEGKLNKKAQVDYLNGTGALQINELFSDTRTVGDGATDSLDLAAALVNLYGSTITFTAIKGFLLSSAVANTTNLTVEAPAAAGIVGLFTALGDGIIIKPGGLILVADPSAAGYAVTPDTADLLDVVNAAGAAATFDIAIFGEI